MRVLHTVKYYLPSKGGMESVVKDIVEGISVLSADTKFYIYSNNHIQSFRQVRSVKGNAESIKARTPAKFRSQPLNLFYGRLKGLVHESEIIHHHYPFPNMELAYLRLLPLLRKKRFIITWHANIRTSRWSWLAAIYDPLIKKLLDIAEFIVVTSPQLLENSDILPAYKEKIRVIPLSFSPAMASEVLPKKFPENRLFRLLFVGKLREYKGLRYLIDAIKEIDIELTIIGDGENREELRKQTELLNIQNKIYFRNDLTSEDLLQEYKNADLFVLPSINEAEAFGVVQLEAMANALPVINTNLKSGVPFVSINEETGLTVEPRNSGALKKAIERIITDRSLYEVFSDNSLKRSKLFTRDKMAQSYKDLYNI